jgi:hypothetical protein
VLAPESCRDLARLQLMIQLHGMLQYGLGIDLLPLLLSISSKTYFECQGRDSVGAWVAGIRLQVPADI